MNILLLKTNDSTTPTNDRYIEYIESKKSNKILSISQINLLKFNYQNLDLLKSKLFNYLLSKENYEQNFKCLILTSRQTIEAIQECLKLELENFDTNQDRESIHIDTNILNHDNKLIVYCVGESTTNRFKKFIQLVKNLNENIESRLILRQVDESKKTEHKQNANELSKLIIQDYELIKSTIQNIDKYALYPCSSIRKDDLSNNLAEASISYEEIHAYNTEPCEKSIEKFNKFVIEHKHEDNLLVFFSPSGCDAVFKSQNSIIQDNNNNSVKFVSIGPSTSSRLKQYIKHDLIFELTQPSPQALWDCLTNISNF